MNLVDVEQQSSIIADGAAALGFPSLVRFVQQQKAWENRNHTANADLHASFLALLPAVEVVSFDIFDTALIRYVDHPADVFLHLENMPAFAAHRLARPVSTLRINAESTARNMVLQVLGSMEVNLLEIYQVFCDLAGLSREFAEGFVAAEEEVELRLCVALPPIQWMYREAAAQGKRVVFVSDTYHTRDFLTRLLHRIGYPVVDADLFVSSEARKAKQSGDLFPEVVKALGVAPEMMLHFGDHPVSDFERPQSMGIACILHSHKASAETPELMIGDQRPKVAGDDVRMSQKSLVRGMVRATKYIAGERGRGDDFWWKFGYSAAGPLTAGFCQWLEAALRADGMKHAYFMLRDGELFFKVYQAMFRADRSAVTASALDSSRRAMLVPIVETAPAFALPSLLAGIGERPVREYLERLGVKVDGFEAEAVAAGFSSLDEMIDGRSDTTRLLKFMVQMPVLRALLDRCHVEHEALRLYLEQHQVTREGDVALVDLGWGGTIHKSLQLMLEKSSPATRLAGYYLATFPEAAHSIIANTRVRSYLAHRGEPKQVCVTISSFLNLFEIVYSSTAGSLLYFEKSGAGKEIAAVRQAPDKSAEQSAQLEAIHAGVLAFAEDYQRLTAGCGLEPMSPEVASEEFFRVVRKPTCEEAVLLGGLSQCDNLGSASTHVSARLSASDDPAQLLDEYDKGHWKKGMLTLPTPEAAALRTILWLQEHAV